MVWSDKILGIVTLAYLALFLLHLVYFRNEERDGPWRSAAHPLCSFRAPYARACRALDRIVQAGHRPRPFLSNFYESLIFFAWCIALILIVMKKRLRLPVISMLATFAALLFMGYASLSPSVDRQIQPLIPALQSNWLHVHVFTCFIAYASFAISFLAALLYLIRPEGHPRQPAGRGQLPGRRGRLSHAHRGHPDGRGLGALRVGRLLELGPQRDMVAHHVDRLRPFPPRPLHGWMEGAEDRVAFDSRFRQRHFRLFRRKLHPFRPPQLGAVLKEKTRPQTHFPLAS